jgi:sulfite exporter TauE/SafE
MSPSRGASQEVSTTPEPSTDTKANIRSSSALKSAQQNIKFLFSPDSTSSPRPARLRTRALLRSLRYIGIFVFWRVVRYAKYALVGSIVAAVGASAFGGVVSGAAFVLAPPTLATSVGIGLIWAAGKWGFRKMRVGEMAAVEVKDSQSRVTQDGQWRDVQGPRAVPW